MITVMWQKISGVWHDKIGKRESAWPQLGFSVSYISNFLQYSSYKEHHFMNVIPKNDSVRCTSVTSCANFLENTPWNLEKDKTEVPSNLNRDRKRIVEVVPTFWLYLLVFWNKVLLALQMEYAGVVFDVPILKTGVPLAFSGLTPSCLHLKTRTWYYNLW